MSLLRQFVTEVRSSDFAGFGVDKARIPGPTEGWDSWAGVPIDERAALRQLTVHACVALISDTISSLPVGVFRTVNGFPRPVQPTPRIIDQPHAEMDRVEWMGIALTSLLLRGNFYGQIIERDGLGFPTQVEPMHPDQVWPRRNYATGRIEYRVSGRTGVKILPAFDMLHVKGLKLPGPYELTGLDPVAYARNTIGTALAAEEFGARFFGDGAQPAGVLSSDAKIDTETAQEMQARFDYSHGHRRRKTAVLGGGLKWQTISLNAEESQFLATIDAKRGEIAGFYRCPPHMVGMVHKTTSWGTGVEEQSLGFVTHTLGIWVVRLERALSRVMLPAAQYARINVAGLLRGRLTERYRAYLMGRQGGWLSIDDVRALEEMAPLDEGKGGDYLTPLNYAPIPPGGAIDPTQDPNPPPPPVVEPP